MKIPFKIEFDIAEDIVVKCEKEGMTREEMQRQTFLVMQESSEEFTKSLPGSSITVTPL